MLSRGNYQPEDEEMDISDEEDKPIHNPKRGLGFDARGDRLQALKQKIVVDKFDTDAWQQLLTEAQSRDLGTSRQTFEDFFLIFPTSGRYWRYYAEQEIRSGNFEAAENIFQRSLLACPNVELWKGYIKYMLDHKSRLPNSKEMIVKAFEFAIANVGMDISATQIWTDYLVYVKNERTNSQSEESQKLDALRKIYQRAVCTPMQNLEALWKEYDQYENNRNKTLAKALITEFSKKYMEARQVFRERKNYIEGISRNALARPPRGHSKEQHQVLLWKRLLDYEKRNPQHLEPDQLAERVTFTYNQALLCLYHYPEIWHQAAMYQQEIGKPDQCQRVFERAVQAVPESNLLQFQLCDFLERRAQIKEASAVYEKLINARNAHSLVWIQYMRFARRTQGVQAARKIFFKARKQYNCTHHLYVAAALMEYYVNKDERVARNVFELGSKKFFDEPDFLMEYVNFLFHSNQENDMRVLFEKVLATVPKDRAGEVWNLFLRFESLCGNLESITRIEKRRAQAFPEQDPSGVLTLVQRYRFLDLWPCSPGELQSFYQVFKSAETKGKGKEKASEEKVKEAAANKERLKGQKHLFMPDLNQMVPFQPELPTPGSSALSNVVASFIGRLPIAAMWDGPLVDVNKLAQSILDSPYELLQRRPKKGGEGGNGDKAEDSDEEEETTQSDSTTIQAGSTDLYRQRMLKKLTTKLL